MEDQHTEWKESWRDEYLKELCAFANAGGGELIIGVNDQGMPVGLHNAKRLLEELPNKVRDKLGIVPEVASILRDGKECIRIAVTSYPSLVSYNGRFYYRSGSTVQELNGNTLQSMLLSRQGIDWDSVTVPGVSVDDLSERAFQLFRKKAVASGREQESFLMESKEAILRNLKLMRDGMLTRAAVILFHPDPEMYVFGSTIKVGFFLNDADLLFQDMLEGSLMEQLDMLEGMFKIKYLKAYIYYKGFQRIEDYLFPWEGLREAILNACIHKAYEERIPVAIKVFENKIYIYNPGHLPEGWTPETLLKSHESKPRNQLLANAFYRCGEIEAWGRGIGKIIKACHDAQLPPPAYTDVASVCILFDGTEKLARLKEVTKAQDGKKKTSEERKAKGGPKKGGPEKSGPKKGGPKKGGPEKGGPKTRDRILVLLADNPQMTVLQLQENIKVTRSVIMKHISKLKRSGRLKRIGPAKGGHWEVLERQDGV